MKAKSDSVTIMKRTVALALCTCCCGITTSCVTTEMGQTLGSLGAGLGAGLIANANGANRIQALAIGAGAAVLTYVALRVISQRQTEAREREQALARARASRSKSNYVYVPVKSSGGKTDLVGVNKSTGTVSSTVKTVETSSIPSDRKIALNNTQGDVIY